MEEKKNVTLDEAIDSLTTENRTLEQLNEDVEYMQYLMQIITGNMANCIMTHNEDERKVASEQLDKLRAKREIIFGRINELKAEEKKE